MVLKFYSDIIPDEQKEMHWWMTGVEGVSFTDIDAFLAGVPDEDPNLDLYIHCNGGSIAEGWAIVDKLRATGKKITATIDGRCASMATCILLAASERKAYRHAELLIHNPAFMDFYVDTATAESLQKAADQLKADKDKILDFYVERTGADREVLSALMDEDKFIDMDKALELGFIQEIIPDASASTKHRRETFNTNRHMAKNTDKKGILTALAETLGIRVNIVDEPVNYTLQTADGSEITIDIPEGQDPVVGDPASPDGEFEMPDGRTFVIAEGAITEIRPAEDSETDQLRQQVADLTAQNAQLQARVTELEGQNAALNQSQVSEADRDVLARVEAAGGLDWLKTVTSSNYKPKPKKVESQNTTTGIEARIKVLKERNGIAE